jgi:hypothetical protein
LEKQKKSDCGKKLERERREIVGIERVRKFPKMEDVRKKVDEPNSGLREKVEFLSLEKNIYFLFNPISHNDILDCLSITHSNWGLQIIILF